jgi:hypothetical protein
VFVDVWRWFRLKAHPQKLLLQAPPMSARPRFARNHRSPYPQPIPTCQFPGLARQTLKLASKDGVGGLGDAEAGELFGRRVDCGEGGVE